MNRIGYLGGSDIAVIAGLSKYKTPVELYLEKRGESQPQEDNRILRLGRKLESLIAEEYTIETGEKLRQLNKPIIDKQHHFLQGHIDRVVVGKKKFLEIKSTRFASRDEWDLDNNKIPDSYMLQVQFYYGISDFSECSVPLLEAGQTLKIYEIEKDIDLIKDIKILAIDFWDRIQTSRPPEPISENDCKLLYATQKGSSILVSEEIKQDISKLKEVKEEIKNLQKAEKELATKIKIFAKDFENLVDSENTTLATLADSKRNSLDIERIKSEIPEIYSSYLAESKTKNLRLK